jgi:HSP20 family protein
MTTLLPVDPFREALSLRKAIDQLFEQSFVRPGWTVASRQTVAPALLDAYETAQGYRVRFLLPGVRPEDIDLTIQENTLVLKGQVPAFVGSDEQVRWLVQEITPGRFERSMTFPRPIDADHVECTYEHGMLTLWLPIVEASRPKRISVAGADAQPQSQQAAATVEAGAAR